MLQHLVRREMGYYVAHKIIEKSEPCLSMGNFRFYTATLAHCMVHVIKSDQEGFTPVIQFEETLDNVNITLPENNYVFFPIIRRQYNGSPDGLHTLCLLGGVEKNKHGELITMGEL